MAKSAVTGYSSLLKEIASGLTDQDVKDIKLLLRYPAATKITTGTELLVEMDKRDQLDEDNLETLKDVLGKQQLNRLVKIVEKFEKASADTSQGDQLAKSWPSAAFKEKQQQPLNDRLSQSATSAGIQDQLQRQPVLQQNVPWMAPPESYQGNLPREHLQQSHQTPGVGYPMQHAYNTQAAVMNPNINQQGPQNQYQQSSHFPGNAPPAMGYYNGPNQQQLSVQQQQQMMRYQQQQFQTPGSQPCQPYLVTSYPPGYQSNTGTPYQQPAVLNTEYQQPPGNDPHTIQRVKFFPSSTPPGGLGHAKVAPSKSCPSQFQRAPQRELPQVSEEEAGLKPDRSNTQTTKEMNIPAGNMDAVAKTTGVKTVNGNLVMGTSSMAGESSPSGLASQFVGENATSVNGGGQGTVPFQTGRMRADSGLASQFVGENATSVNGGGQHTVPFQTGRMRADSEGKNNKSMGEGVHPMSQQMTETEADLLLLSGFSGKKLYEWRKVYFIANGSYQVRIPQGVHYVTTEGAFAIVPFNSSYTIQLSNNDNHLRCSALVENNGNIAGDWTIDPMGNIIVERPATDNKKFHFMKASHAPLGSGVRVDDPNNGVICVTFTPEKHEALNDLSRGFGHFGISSNGDYFESDDMNDVQRSIVPQAGCTVLHGNSHQRFTRSEHFQLDNASKRTIVLKLVGKST